MYKPWPKTSILDKESKKVETDTVSLAINVFESRKVFSNNKKIWLKAIKPIKKTIGFWANDLEE